MGVPWDQVHAEAEKWEHVLSEEMEERMDEILGSPTTDPHGSPIPSRTLEMVEFATLAWIDWFNTRRLLEPIGYVQPAEFEAGYYEQAAVA